MVYCVSILVSGVLKEIARSSSKHKLTLYCIIRKQAFQGNDIGLEFKLSSTLQSIITQRTRVIYPKIMIDVAQFVVSTCNVLQMKREVSEKKKTPHMHSHVFKLQF